MKRITSLTFNQAYFNIMLLIIRLCAGGFMLTHGVKKMSKLFSGEPITFADPIGLGEPASLVLTVFSEVICSVLIMLGLWTRLAVIPLIITMTVAVFIIHATDPFGKKELGLLYLVVYLLLLVTGSGKYSVDRFLK